MTNDHVLTIWRDEFDEIYRIGRSVQSRDASTGDWRPSRLRLLRSMIRYIQGKPDIWFCTCREAAEAFRRTS